jgi:heme/copper-type cytochrome/quinol oxidase subunit 2
VSTIIHLLLGVVLTLFLALQVNSLVFVLRSRRATAGPRRRPADLLWTAIPVVIVLFLAARSWVAVFDIERSAMAAATAPAVAPLTPPR